MNFIPQGTWNSCSSLFQLISDLRAAITKHRCTIIANKRRYFYVYLAHNIHKSILLKIATRQTHASIVYI